MPVVELIQGEVPIISDLSKLIGEGPVTVPRRARSGERQRPLDAALDPAVHPVRQLDPVRRQPADPARRRAGRRQLRGQRRARRQLPATTRLAGSGHPQRRRSRQPRRRLRGGFRLLVDRQPARRVRSGPWLHLRRLRPDVPVPRQREPDLRRPDGQGRDARPLRRGHVRRRRGLRLLLPADPDRAGARADLHRRLVPRRGPLRDRLRHVRVAQGARGRHRYAPARRHLPRRLQRRRCGGARGQVHRHRLRRGRSQRLHLQGRHPRRDHLHDLAQPPRRRPAGRQAPNRGDDLEAVEPALPVRRVREDRGSALGVRRNRPLHHVDRVLDRDRADHAARIRPGRVRSGTTEPRTRGGRGRCSCTWARKPSARRETWPKTSSTRRSPSGRWSRSPPVRTAGRHGSRSPRSASRRTSS